MNSVGFIPARGGSKSIPKKNIKSFLGKPLIFWTIEAALACKYIDKLFVSTDSLEIKEIIEKRFKRDVTVIDRSLNTATDSATTESVIEDFFFNYDLEFDFLTLIQATSPLLTSQDLDKAFQMYYANDFDSMVSVVEQKRFLWKKHENIGLPINYAPINRPRRQDFDGIYVENGAFYITKRKLFLSSNCRISGKIGLFPMHVYTYFELDEPEDWPLCENLLSRLMKNKINCFNNFNKIKMVLTDCDGVLTDGGMYYSSKGDEMKKFNTKDGKGFELLRNENIITGIITGERISLVRERALKLKVDELFEGVLNKYQIIKNLCKKYNVKEEEVAYIGDDLNDLETLQKVGFSCAVNDAAKIVKDSADYICNAKGGYGAFREIAELIISSNIDKG